MAAVQEGTRSHRAQTRGGWNVSWARLGCFFSRSWWSWWTCLIPFFICLYLDFYNFPWHNIHVTVLEGGSGGHLLFACVKVSTCCLSGVPPAPHVLLVLDQWFFSAALQDPWFYRAFSRPAFAASVPLPAQVSTWYLLTEKPFPHLVTFVCAFSGSALASLWVEWRPAFPTVVSGLLTRVTTAHLADCGDVCVATGALSCPGAHYLASTGI